MTRRYEVAQHEAAHIVVGLAVGLRVRRAVLGDKPSHGTWREYGCVWFNDRHATPTQLALAYAAGCAWDRAYGEESEGDYRLLRMMRHTKKEIGALVIAASAIIHGRSLVHVRVARALYERDLLEADFADPAYWEVSDRFLHER